MQREPHRPIDAHLHVWRIDAAWHGWPAAGENVLYRDFTLAAARAAARGTGVAGARRPRARDRGDGRPCP